MKCEHCGEGLSAGDISVFPKSDGEIDFKVICHNCDTIQSSSVLEENGIFYVLQKKGGE